LAGFVDPDGQDTLWVDFSQRSGSNSFTAAVSDLHDRRLPAEDVGQLQTEFDASPQAASGRIESLIVVDTTIKVSIFPRTMT